MLFTSYKKYDITAAIEEPNIAISSIIVTTLTAFLFILHLHVVNK